MLAVIISAAILILLALGLVAAASRHKKSAGAPLAVIGRVATVERDLAPEGAVLVCGELMPARSRTGCAILRTDGARVRVVGARGHLLEVELQSQGK